MTKRRGRKGPILVLGMHRSGTSAVAGVLKILGVELGSELLPPRDDNPRGFWEHRRIVELHEAVLDEFGSQWDDPRALPEGWWERNSIEPYRERLRQLLTQEFGAATRWAVKDPRLCRLLPLWRTVLADLRMPPSVLLVLRHPGEVARSLAVRNGFPTEKSLSLWLDHTLAAEASTRGWPRCVVQYGDLLADWRSEVRRMARALSLRWPKSMRAVEKDVDGFLRPELRHHASSGRTLGDTGRLPAWVEHAYSVFLKGSSEPSGRMLRELTTLRRRFDEGRELLSWQAGATSGDATRGAQQPDGVSVMERAVVVPQASRPAETATVEDLTWAYRVFLARDPEATVVENFVPDSCSVASLHRRLLASEEFQSADRRTRAAQWSLDVPTVRWCYRLLRFEDVGDDAAERAVREYGSLLVLVESLRRGPDHETLLRDAEAQASSNVVRLYAKSMPRSGHHLMVDLLREYFGPELHYCEFYHDEHPCCHAIPCTRPYHALSGNRFFLQKSHDFELADPTALPGKYIIQYRHPVPRMQSNFDYSLSVKKGDDTAERFRKFGERDTEYFIRFWEKWMKSPQPNAFLLSYEELTADPQAALRRLIQFIRGTEDVNERALADALRVCRRPSSSSLRQGSVALRQPHEYRHYDEAYYRAIENVVFASCPGLALPRLFPAPDPSAATGANRRVDEETRRLRSAVIPMASDRRLNPVDHPVIYHHPPLLRPSDWWEHVPFGMWIVDVVRPAVVVELGTGEGVAYFAFCQAVQELGLGTRCYGVDTWTGAPGSGASPETLADLQVHHDAHFGRFSRLVRSRSEAAVLSFEDGSVDLLHVKPRETLEELERDLTTWLPKMSPRGVLLLDGTNAREVEAGGWRVWERLKGSHPHFEFLHGGGLGVLAVGAEVSDRLQALLDARDNDVPAIRALFDHLGSRWRAEEVKRQRATEYGADRQRSAAQLQTVASRRDTLSARLERLEAEYRTAAADLAATTMRLADHETDRQRLVADLEATTAQRDALEAEREELRNQLTAAGEHRDLLTAELDTQRRIVEHGEAEQDQLRVHAQNLEADRDQLRVHAGNLEADRARLIETSEERAEQLQAVAGQLQAIQSSRAWRALERWGRLKYRLFPARSARRRVYDSIMSAAERLVRQRPTGASTLADSSASNGGAIGAHSEVHGHLDIPNDAQQDVVDVLIVSGWACSSAGIESITVSLDGEPWRTLEGGGHRPDIGTAFPGVPDAGRSGIYGAFDLEDVPHGAHELTLEVHDRAGQTFTYTTAFRRITADEQYEQIYRAALPSADEVASLARRLDATEPTIVFECWIDALDSADGLSESVRALSGQQYPHWRCHVLAPSDRHEAVGRLVAAAAGERADRIGLRETLRTSLAAPDGKVYYGFLRAGEQLTPDSLIRVAAGVQGSGHPDVVYTDHDTVRPDGRHAEPHFKPDWSPDYALARDYVGGCYFARSDVLTRALESAAAVERWGPAWRYDLLLRLTETAGHVVHLDEVLWSVPDGNPPIDLFADEAEAVTAALERRGLAAAVECLGDGGYRRLRWRIGGEPRVSVIIPTTGRMDHLEPCIETLLGRTAYRNFQVVAVDNGRGEYPEGIRYLRDRGIHVVERHEPFNWARLNNAGAREAEGDLLLFLNDDVEIVDPEWLDELVAQALRPDVGSVGALLLLPDGLIQHAGVFLVDHGGGARHLLAGVHPEQEIYQGLHKVTREVSASTGACLMLRREVFEAVNGFDEALPIVGNDIDLCLRLRERGYRNLWTPHAVLVHHESLSRKEITIDKDEHRMWQRWEEVLLRGDPFYSRHLAQDRSDCALRTDVPPRRPADAREEPAGRCRDGVNLIGYIRAEMGVGQAARAIASCMDAASLPFVIIDYEEGNPARKQDDTWVAKIVDRPRFGVNLLHVNADWTAAAVEHLGADMFANRYTIGYWAWELPEFPDKWRGAFDCVDEVWVPSFFVQDAVARKSPVPVIRIPHAISDPHRPLLPRDHFGLPERCFLFLSMFDTHSVTQRKNPEGAIKAFRQAFEQRDRNVGLVVKMMNAAPAALEQIRELIGGHHNVHLITETLSRHEVDSLLGACDCFVSLHRSEGFGFGLAEAMNLGKPVIGTNWSGNTDFMNEKNAACVEYQLVSVGEGCGPYEQQQLWADPDVEHAAWWMRALQDDPATVSRLGQAARDVIARDFSPEAVGRLIAQRIRAIALSRAA